MSRREPCKNPDKHYKPGTGIWLLDGECSECIRDERDALRRSPARGAEVTVTNEMVYTAIEGYGKVTDAGLISPRAMYRALSAALEGGGQPITLTRRHLKSRAISDDTFSEHSEGWDDAMDEVGQQLEARGIPVQWVDWNPLPPVGGAG